MSVCVTGAGVSGICAALQVARSGQKCILIEKSGIPGGTLTLGGVACPGLFHAWNGKQVIAGIGWELVKECVELADGKMPDFTAFDMEYFWHYQVPVNPVLFACLCDKKFKEANVDVRYHTMLADVKRENGKWCVTLCGKDGLYDIECDIIIDCTGDANAVKMAGFAVAEPQECQPGTVSVRCSGYDAEKSDWDSLRSAFNEAMERGEVLKEDIGWTKGFARLFIQRYGENANHIHFPAETWSTPRGRSDIEVAGRESLLRIYTFLKKQPGFENLDMRFSGVECGIRESRTIVGETTVTEEDWLAGKSDPDAVCYGFYPVDLHDDKEFIIKKLLPEGVVPMIPGRAMIPKGSEGLLAAGRIVASDRMANSALRIQATCMATGQAAGAWAALCVKHNKSVRTLDYQLLRRELAEHNAILPTLK